MRGGAADGAAGGPDDRRTARCRVAIGASVSIRAAGGRRAAGRASAWWSWWCWSAGGAGSSCGSSRRHSGRCFFSGASAPGTGGSSSLAVDAGARSILIDSRLRTPSMAGGARGERAHLLLSRPSPSCCRRRRRRSRRAALADALALFEAEPRAEPQQIRRAESQPQPSLSQPQPSRSRAGAEPQPSREACRSRVMCVVAVTRGCIVSFRGSW